MEKLTKTRALERTIKYYIEQQNDLQVSMVLQRILISQMREDENAKIILAYTNKLLMKVTKRWDGLLLLNKLMDHCPSSLVNENANFWVNTCVNIDTEDQITVVRFTILTSIIRSCSSNVSDLNKPTFYNTLPKIADMCVSIKPTPILSSAALTCLEVCMEKFSSTYGRFKDKIESYLLKYFTCELHSAIIKKAGAAFNALQQIGGAAGLGGIAYERNWTNQMNKLCATIHKLYDNFLPHMVDFESVDQLENTIPYEFPELASGDQNEMTLHTQVTVLKNITIFIDSMLVGRFPVEKHFRISSLMSVIKRGLSADLLGDYNKSFNDEKLEAALYIHHVHLLRLLKSFIAKANQHFFREPDLTKLLLDCLQRAQMQPFENSNYKEAVYEVLTDWISNYKNIISEVYPNKLLGLILNDITPEKTNVTLVLNDNNKAAGLENEAEKVLPKIKASTCTKALKCGVALFTHLRLDNRDRITKGIIHTLIQLSLDVQTKEIMYPYKNEQCQTCLYEMLVSSLLQPMFCQSAVIQTVTNILIKGQQRSSFREVCHRGMGLLRNICQPICPTLIISQQVDDDYASIRRKRRRVSETSDVDDIEFLETTMIIDPDSPECTPSPQNDNNTANPQDDNLQDDNPQDDNPQDDNPQEYTSSLQQQQPQSSENVRILDVQVIKPNNYAEIVDIDDVKMEVETDIENTPQGLISSMKVEEVSEKIETNYETDLQQNLKQEHENNNVIKCNVEELENQTETCGIKMETTSPVKNSDDEDRLAELVGAFQDVVNENYYN